MRNIKWQQLDQSFKDEIMHRIDAKRTSSSAWTGTNKEIESLSSAHYVKIIEAKNNAEPYITITKSASVYDEKTKTE